MKGNFEDIIRNKIESPEVEPKIDLWGAIESDLLESEFNSSLVEKLNELEIADPSNRVWNKIESSLHKEPKSFAISHNVFWSRKHGFNL